MSRRPSKGNLVTANSAQAMTAPVMHPQPSSPDMRFLNGLPHRSSLELGAYDTAPRTARGHLASVLAEWSLPEFTDVALLVASELITNSVLEMGKASWAAGRPPVRLWLYGGPAILAVLVWDAIADPPVPRTAGTDDESGRGLAIIAALSAECGFYYPARMGGKVTWTVIDTP